VPALVIDGRVLTEVAATLYYLAKTYPAKPGCGRGAASRPRRRRSRGCRSSPRPCTRRGAPATSAGARSFIYANGGSPDKIGRSAGITRSPTSTSSACSGALSTRCTRRRAIIPGLMAHYERMMARAAVKQTIATESAIGYEFPR
jgi:glutathione S-transferase